MRLTKSALPALFILAAFGCVRDPDSQASQMKDDARWWTYLADYDGLPGSTVVNLALMRTAPMSAYSTLVVTGVGYSAPPERSGLPNDAELDFLNELSEKRLAVIAQTTKLVFAGSFTHKGERLDYIYVMGASGVEERLQEFYEAAAPARTKYISVKSDAEWKAYVDFLYPNEQTRRQYQAELRALGVDPR